MTSFPNAQYALWRALPRNTSAQRAGKGEERDLMSVYGGLEYTEATISGTRLRSYPGTNPVVIPAVPPVETLTVGDSQIGVYSIAPANVGLLGALRGSDFKVFQAGRVKLTNDTTAAEWIIEGHKADGLNVDAMISNMKQDIASAIALRQQLKHVIDLVKQGNPPANLVILAPGATANLLPAGPQGLFEYTPGNVVNGAAQITVQYENPETIKRICLLNASKYLPGKKIAMGDDADMVAGSMVTSLKYKVGQSSFASAEALLQALVDLAVPIASENGVLLSREQVGLIMLMVLNDAMASTMRRHAAAIGQTDDKNVQRFFPKSRRDRYVIALAKRPFGDQYFQALRNQITSKADQIATLEWNSCDPYALIIAPTQATLALDASVELADIQSRGLNNKPVTNVEITRVKNAVLGMNAADLAARLGRAALAYTDTSDPVTVPPPGHYAGPNGNVILSLQFTPVTPGKYGAVYEFRDNEVPMTMDNRDDVLNVMRTLFSVA
jgi:hypothetical protein